MEDAPSLGATLSKSVLPIPSVPRKSDPAHQAVDTRVLQQNAGRKPWADRNVQFGTEITACRDRRTGSYTVKTATKPPQPIEKSTAGASLLAQVIVAKNAGKAGGARRCWLRLDTERKWRVALSVCIFQTPASEVAWVRLFTSMDWAVSEVARTKRMYFTLISGPSSR
jgi:hypothetical protein